MACEYLENGAGASVVLIFTGMGMDSTYLIVGLKRCRTKNEQKYLAGLWTRFPVRWQGRGEKSSVWRQTGYEE
jgi:hypothetical protein